MNIRRSLNIVLAIAAVAAWVVLAAMFDKQLFEGDQRHNAQREVQQRKQLAALKICGPGGTPRWIDDTTLNCRLHNGKGRGVITAGVML